MMFVGDGATIPGTVVQYNETDWAFAKRLASHFNSVLLPNSHLDGKKFYFGLQSSPARHVLDTVNYSVKRVKGQLAPECDMSSPARDMIYYIVKEREIYHLGNCVILNGMELYVSAIETELVGSELYHTYFLKSRDDFHSPKIYNPTLIGASMQGNILTVQRDVVEVTLTDDENAAGAGTRWYPYSTVYSSPDGTGWYCMPEPGDAVRLYFPTMNESQAYVISSTHEASPGRSEPDNKSIKNKQEKEVLFMPDKLIVTNNDGMSIIIDDAEGITIASDKNIVFEAADTIQVISGEEVDMIASVQISMEQGETAFALAEVVGMQGSQVRLD